jgi:hypothetical protein
LFLTWCVVTEDGFRDLGPVVTLHLQKYLPWWIAGHPQGLVGGVENPGLGIGCLVSRRVNHVGNEDNLSAFSNSRFFAGFAQDWRLEPPPCHGQLSVGHGMSEVKPDDQQFRAAPKFVYNFEQQPDIQLPLPSEQPAR